MADEHMMPLDDDVHLARLLAPPNVEEPWFKTIFKGIHEFFHPPKPPELTSQPAEVKDIWGAYGGLEKAGRATPGCVHIRADLLRLFFNTLNTPRPARPHPSTG